MDSSKTLIEVLRREKGEATLARLLHTSEELRKLGADGLLKLAEKLEEVEVMEARLNPWRDDGMDRFILFRLRQREK